MAQHSRFDGFATVERVAPPGMISLRADLSEPGVAAVLGALGLALPGPRRIVTAAARSVAWMSPDELLLIAPRGEVAAALAQIATGLAGRHHMAVDLSDARAVFRIGDPAGGQAAREVLAKLCPVDLAPGVFGPGEIRRTRAAQVACAFWMPGEGEFTLVCFRSVAAYVFDLLSVSARPGSELGLYA